MFLGPLFLLTLRTGKWVPFLKTIGGTAGAWLVVNLPIMIFAFDGWKRFYVFSQERPADWGSLWYFFHQKQWPFLGDSDRLDLLGILSLGAFCLAIAVLAMTRQTRPRLMQLCFLTLAAFMLTNKVWSPQYVLWLIPFAVLARPNWKAIVLWQIAECLVLLRDLALSGRPPTRRRGPGHLRRHLLHRGVGPCDHHPDHDGLRRAGHPETREGRDQAERDRRPVRRRLRRSPRPVPDRARLMIDAVSNWPRGGSIEHNFAV